MGEFEIVCLWSVDPTFQVQETRLIMTNALKF